MAIAENITASLGDSWLTEIYRTKVRAQRTRSYHLGVPERENQAEIQHTLLGIELKVGKIRLACPDLSTARYLRVFARLGCPEIAIPYDISKISTIADELESSWQRILLLFESETADKTPSLKGRLRSALIKEIRSQLHEVGAGEAMPEFKQTTRQGY